MALVAVTCIGEKGLINRFGMNIVRLDKSAAFMVG